MGTRFIATSCFAVRATVVGWLIVALGIGIAVASAADVAAQTSKSSSSSEARRPADVCIGPRDRRIRPKVVDGWKAKREQWPGFVALRVFNSETAQAQYFCGGSLIAPRWILTAAHCFDAFDVEEPGNQPVPTSRLDRYVGGQLGFTGPARLQIEFESDDLRESEPARLGEVRRIIRHPGYAGVGTAQSNGNDIALVELAEPRNGPFMRLSMDRSSDPPTPPGSRVMVAGFGYLTEGAAPKLFTNRRQQSFTAGAERLQEVDLPTVEPAACKAVYTGLAIGDGQVCAGYPAGQKDSCQGDSGGPLVAFDNWNCPYQVGLVSWGDGCAQKDSYGVYTWTSFFAQWIRNEIQGPVVTVAAADTSINGDKAALKAIAKTAVAEIETLLAGTTGKIRLRLIRFLDGSASSNNGLKLNDRYRVEVTSAVPGRLVLIDLDAGGDIVQIFPNKYAATAGQQRLERGGTKLIPSVGYPFDWFRAVDPTGASRLVAIIVPDSFAFSTSLTAPLAIDANKALEPEPAPLAYVAAVLDQIYRSLSAEKGAAGGGAGWAYATMDYTILP